MRTPPQIVINRDVCVGAGQCVMRAADVFEHDRDGAVHLRREHFPDDAWDDVADAVENCPVSAISLRIEEGGQIRAG